MTNRISSAIFVIALAIAVTTPADAASKEQQQMMADLRILQEQAQQLQNLIGSLTGSLTDALKVVNARIDEQINSNRKALADHKLVMDTLSSDVRVIRERLDDNGLPGALQPCWASLLC